MTTITSLIIPRIDADISAKFITDTFDKNGIAKVSSVYKYSDYTCVNIETWHDTKKAHDFIGRLRDHPTHGVRLFYNDDNCWSVKINNEIMLRPYLYMLFKTEASTLYQNSNNNPPIEPSSSQKPWYKFWSDKI